MNFLKQLLLVTRLSKKMSILLEKGQCLGGAWGDGRLEFSRQVISMW